MPGFSETGRERGSLQLDSSLVIGLLVLIAAVTLFAFGTSIACLFAKEASQVNRVPFYTTAPEVTTSPSSEGEVVFDTEGMTGPFTIMRGRPGNPDYNPSEVSTWDVLLENATSPATGLDVKDGDRVAIVANVERCGFRLVGAVWPETIIPSAEAWYGAGISVDPDNYGARPAHVGAYSDTGDQVWVKPATVDGQAIEMVRGLSVSEGAMYAYIVDGWNAEGIYSMQGWKSPTAPQGDMELIAPAIVSDSSGTSYRLNGNLSVAGNGTNLLVSAGRTDAGGSIVGHEVLCIDTRTLRVYPVPVPAGVTEWSNAVHGAGTHAFAISSSGQVYRLGNGGAAATHIGDLPNPGTESYYISSVDSVGNIATSDMSGNNYIMAPDGTHSQVVPEVSWYSSRAADRAEKPVLLVDGYPSRDTLRLFSADAGTNVRESMFVDPDPADAPGYIEAISSVMGNANPMPPAIPDAAPVTVSDTHPIYRDEATISLVARDEDQTGVKTTYWSLDGAPVEEGTSVYTNEIGTHVLEFWSDDTAVEFPMVEERNEVTFEVVGGTPSTHMPDTTSDAVPLYEIVDAPGSPTEAAITLTAYDPDPATPVSNTYWILDGGAVQTGTDVRTSEVGVHTLEFWSDDTASPDPNVEAPHNMVRFEVTKDGGGGGGDGAWNYSVIVNGETVYSRDFIPTDPDSVILNATLDSASPADKIAYAEDLGGGEYLYPWVRMRTDRTLDPAKSGRSDTARFNANAIGNATPTEADGFIRPFGTVSSPDKTLSADGVHVVPWAASHLPAEAPYISLIEHGDGHIAASGPNATLASNLCLSVTAVSENGVAEGAGVNREYVLGGSSFIPQPGEVDPSRTVRITAPMWWDDINGPQTPDTVGGKSMADLSYEFTGISWDGGVDGVPDFSLGFYGNDASFPDPAANSGRLVTSGGTVVSSAFRRSKVNVVEVRVTGGTVRPWTRPVALPAPVFSVFRNVTTPGEYGILNEETLNPVTGSNDFGTGWFVKDGYDASITERVEDNSSWDTYVPAASWSDPGGIVTQMLRDSGTYAIHGSPHATGGTCPDGNAWCESNPGWTHYHDWSETESAAGHSHATSGVAELSEDGGFRCTKLSEGRWRHTVNLSSPPFIGTVGIYPDRAWETWDRLGEASHHPSVVAPIVPEVSSFRMAAADPGLPMIQWEAKMGNEAEFWTEGQWAAAPSMLVTPQGLAWDSVWLEGDQNESIPKAYRMRYRVGGQWSPWAQYPVPAED